jgi:hypothetical protein
VCVCSCICIVFVVCVFASAFVLSVYEEGRYLVCYMQAFTICISKMLPFSFLVTSSSATANSCVFAQPKTQFFLGVLSPRSGFLVKSAKFI